MFLFSEMPILSRRPIQPPTQGLSGFFPAGKAAGPWRRPLTSIQHSSASTTYVPSWTGYGQIFILLPSYVLQTLSNFMKIKLGKKMHNNRGY